VKINGSVLIAKALIPLFQLRIAACTLHCCGERIGNEPWRETSLANRQKGWKGRWGADGVDWRFVGFLIIYSMGPT